MPVSKSKRSRYQPPPKPKPKPSSRWVPIGVITLIAVGVLTLVFYYLSSSSTTGVFAWIRNKTVWPLIFGFSSIAAGFALATQWR